MSEFDKEKEREKLREKYERDEEGRESAEKMSELLLQGATMTNAHCSECGDPIFRYEGQEFCATCEKPVDRGSGEEAPEGEQGGDETADAAQDTDEQIEVTDPSDEARVAFGREERTKAEADQQRGAAEGQNSAPSGPESAGKAGQQSRAGANQPEEATRQVPGIEPHASNAPQGAGEVARARESLVATLERFSQQAAATEDPQRATEYLTAAREAAEALAALRR
jgi:uncharacterized Zn finger protein (UPF0148 family)